MCGLERMVDDETGFLALFFEKAKRRKMQVWDKPCEPGRKWDRVSSINFLLNGGLEDGWMSLGRDMVAILVIGVEVGKSRHGLKLGRSTNSVDTNNRIDDPLGAFGMVQGSCNVVDVPIIA